MKPSLSDQLQQEERQGRVRRMRALIVKEFLQIMRDPSSLMITVLLPLILVFLYGSGVSLDLNHLRVGLVLEDTAPDAQSFAESLKASPYFETKIARDRRELTEEMIRGRLRGIFVIPSYFTQYRYRRDEVAPIQIIADGSETNTANFVKNYGEGVFQNWRTQQLYTQGASRTLPIATLAPRYWYNDAVESRFFLLPGSLAIIMTLTGALLTALVVAREWERGTMEALIATTISVREIILGKIIPYFVLGMISMSICLFFSTVVYGVPLRGSLWVIALVTALFLFCSLGLGLMISTLTKNQIFAYQITLIVAFLPAYILSGFLFEIYSMPKWIQMLTYILPARYFVQSLQTLFLVGNVWSLIIYNMIPIVGIGLIFFIITSIKMVKRLD